MVAEQQRKIIKSQVRCPTVKPPSCLNHAYCNLTNKNTTGYKSLSPFLNNTTWQLKVKMILADFTVSITFVQNNFIYLTFIFVTF